MVLLTLIRVVVFVTLVSGEMDMEVKPEALKEYAEICKNVTWKPFFDRSMVVRKTWIVYYTWNLRLFDVCYLVSFKYPNDLIINRVFKAMSGYLKKEPPWHEAVLVMTLGPSREMLLFNDDSGIPGRFFGVPNMKSRDLFSMFRNKDKVPIFEMAMKLTHRGRYFISSDCRIGVTSLAVRRDKIPSRVEIDAVASSFNFGDGFPACTNGPNEGEK